MSARIDVRSDVARFARTLTDLETKQLPFATALAINDVAFQVMRAENEAMSSVFKHPRPFTKRATQVEKKARKGDLVAIVSIRPDRARYLAPYETGGRHYHAGRGLPVPKDVRLDQYGQLPRNALKRLYAKRGVFVGTVHGVSGFWFRAGLNHVRLLVRFGEAMEVRKRLAFRARADREVHARMPAAFAAAMAKAMRSARR